MTEMAQRALVALTPQELPVVQTEIAQWCRQRILTLASELREARQSLREVKQLMLGSPRAWQNVVRRTTAQMIYYAKLQMAVRAGYLIVPNFPVELIAVRVQQPSPRTIVRDAWPRDMNTAEPQLNLGKNIVDGVNMLSSAGQAGVAELGLVFGLALISCIVLGLYSFGTLKWFESSVPVFSVSRCAQYASSAEMPTSWTEPEVISGLFAAKQITEVNSPTKVNSETLRFVELPILRAYFGDREFIWVLTPRRQKRFCLIGLASYIHTTRRVVNVAGHLDKVKRGWRMAVVHHVERNNEPEDVLREASSSIGNRSAMQRDDEPLIGIKPRLIQQPQRTVSNRSAVSSGIGGYTTRIRGILGDLPSTMTVNQQRNGEDGYDDSRRPLNDCAPCRRFLIEGAILLSIGACGVPVGVIGVLLILDYRRRLLGFSLILLAVGGFTFVAARVILP